MLLAGFTGLISLGHAAFLGVGAYTEALAAGAGMPFLVSLPCAALLSAAVGMVVGLPALRVKGIYLGDRHARLQRHRRGDDRALGER